MSASLIDLRRRVRGVLHAGPVRPVSGAVVALEHRRAQCGQLLVLLAEPHEAPVRQVTAAQATAAQRTPLALTLRLIANQHVHPQRQIPKHQK